MVPVVGGAGRIEELAQSRRIPRVHAVGLLAGSRRVGGVGRVPQQPSPADSVLEGAVQNRVDVVDRAPVQTSGGSGVGRPVGLAAEERGEGVLGDVVGLGHLFPQLCGGGRQRLPLGA